MKEEKGRNQQLGEQLEKLATQAMHHAEQIGINLAGIRIIASFDAFNGKGETGIVSVGAGNWHAQIGAVSEWIRGREHYQAGFNQAAGAYDFNETDDDGPEGWAEK